MAPDRASRQLAYSESLLAISRALILARGIDDVLGALLAEIHKQLGYRHVWIYEMDAQGEEVSLWMAVEQDGVQFAPPQRLSAREDALVRAVAEAREPLVIPDARDDPRTDKRIVDALGNRTIVNVPLRLSNGQHYALGTGSFGDDGVRVPDDGAVQFLSTIAVQTAVAIDRVRIDRERRRLSEEVLRARKLEAVGQLAGGVAHDFNNLLTVILGVLDVSVETLEISESDRDALRLARSAAERGATLTHQLLAVASRSVGSREVIDVNTVVDDVSGLLRSMLPSHVALDVDLDPTPGRAEVDRGQLEQVLMNLVVNARDAMPEGGRIFVSTFRATEAGDPDAAGGHLAIAVRDTGPGMTSELAERAFEPFFTTKRAGEGTGLGLATSRGIVQRAGGRLRLDTTPGEGTRFVVCLPRSREPASPAATRSESPVRAAVDQILLVEDDPDVARVMRVMLEHRGYAVHRVGTAHDAISALDTAGVDLVILDHGLPDLPGAELASTIRERELALPILLVSGDPPDLEELADDPALALLQKPFSMSEILGQIERLASARNGDVSATLGRRRNGDV